MGRYEGCRVVARTTNAYLQPTGPTLSTYHFEALHKLGLEEYIEVEDWYILPKTAWPKVRAWQQRSGPFSTWEQHCVDNPNKITRWQGQRFTVRIPNQRNFGTFS